MHTTKTQTVEATVFSTPGNVCTIRVMQGWQLHLSASLVITTMRPTDTDPLATFALAAVLRIAARIGALDER